MSLRTRFFVNVSHINPITITLVARCDSSGGRNLQTEKASMIIKNLGWKTAIINVYQDGDDYQPAFNGHAIFTYSHSTGTYNISTLSELSFWACGKACIYPYLEAKMIINLS